MSFGSRLRDKRNELNITQPQLAKMLGVSQSAVGSWETDVNSPRATLLYDLFDILHCDANYLFQDETRELYKDEASPEEFNNIIKKYRSLDDFGRETVDTTLERETKRVEKIRTQQERIEKLETKLSEKESEAPLLNAAHADNYMDAPEELKKQEEDIMDDENF
jgi:transcriptional regulator with XRE-family HTH domain